MVPLLVIGAGLAAALALDWTHSLDGYPVAAAYSISLLLTCQYFAPRVVAGVGAIALAMDVGSNVVQGSSFGESAADTAGLLAIVLLAILTAHKRLQAESALSARDEFLAAVSHDLRSPLTVIRGYAQLARKRVSGRWIRPTWSPN